MSWSPGEPAVVRHQRQPKPNSGGGDPPVTVMDLVTERVTDLSAPLTELGTDADHLVIRLGDGELGDTSFQPPAAGTRPSQRARPRSAAP